MSTEADTCRKFVVPKLQAAGWDSDSHSIAEQRSFTDADQRASSLSASIGERAGVRCRSRQQHVAFFKFFAPEAREILNELMQKYASDGELQLVAVRKHLPDVLKVAPISKHGNVAEIANHFGGLEQLGTAVNQLQSLLYAA
jgi:type I restriction enzyme R subunit